MIKKTDLTHRPITHHDASLVLEWRNREDIRKYMYSDHIISTEEHQNWLNQIMPVSQNYRVFEFQGEPVGFASLYDIKPEHGRCYWAFYIGANQTPKGLGSAMEFHMLDYIFIERKFRKLCCEVFGFNERVIAMHKRFGFNIESNFIKHCIKNGHPEDVVGLAIFAPEWEEIRAEMHNKIFV